MSMAKPTFVVNMARPGKLPYLRSIADWQEARRAVMEIIRNPLTDPGVRFEAVKYLGEMKANKVYVHKETSKERQRLQDRKRKKLARVRKHGLRAEQKRQRKLLNQLEMVRAS